MTPRVRGAWLGPEAGAAAITAPPCTLQTRGGRRSCIGGPDRMSAHLQAWEAQRVDRLRCVVLLGIHVYRRSYPSACGPQKGGGQTETLGCALPAAADACRRLRMWWGGMWAENWPSRRGHSDFDSFPSHPWSSVPLRARVQSQCALIQEVRLPASNFEPGVPGQTPGRGRRECAGTSLCPCPCPCNAQRRAGSDLWVVSEGQGIATVPAAAAGFGLVPCGAGLVGWQLARQLGVAAGPRTAVGEHM